MDSANNISRRTLLSAAIAASFVAFPAIPVAALPKRDLDKEFMEAWVELSLSQQIALRDFMRRLAAGYTPANDELCWLLREAAYTA